MTKKIAGALALASSVALLAGCASTTGGGDADGNAVKIAAFEGGYGAEAYQEVVAAYRADNPDVDIELTTSRTLADQLTPQVAAGQYPDLVFLGLGAEEGFTESFVRDRSLEDLTSVLDETVPGEDVTVRDKLTEGVVGGLGTNPYGGDETYLMPMFASPTGLVYDSGLFDEKGWDVPTTWDELFTIADQAQAEGIALFTYPTTGYLDSYFFSLLATVGGEDFYEDVMTYEPDVWMSDEATEALELTTRLFSYASPETVGFANGQDFTKNQQSVLENRTVFMPNGAWISNEMADAPRADGFSWAMAPVPALEAGDERYLTTSIETAWIPAEAEHKDEAKRFLAYVYSDEAADIFLEAGAVQPIQGIEEGLTGDAQSFYSTYAQDDVTALVGAFAATESVPGVDLKAALFDTASGVISGTTTMEQWQDEVNEASNALTDHRTE